MVMRLVLTPRLARSRHGSGPLGVTLLEMLVVITMIGILSAVAMTRLDWTRYRADAAGRGTMAELATAQRLALSLQANMVITFPDSSRMKIVEDANNDGLASNGERVRYVVLDNHV